MPSQEDLIKIAKGAAIAAGGALIAYLTTVLPGLTEQYPVLGPVIAAVAAVGINVARKWLASLNS